MILSQSYQSSLIHSRQDTPLGGHDSGGSHRTVNGEASQSQAKTQSDRSNLEWVEFFESPWCGTYYESQIQG